MTMPFTAISTTQKPVLELKVRNHPGVMSHISGLFARRAFNLEGVLCMPIGDRAYSRIWLKVSEEGRMPQMLKQLDKLEDVLEISCHEKGHEIFEEIGAYFR
jgi:acetolactate synthase-1/3 small subunit